MPASHCMRNLASGRWRTSSRWGSSSSVGLTSGIGNSSCRASRESLPLELHLREIQSQWPPVPPDARALLLWALKTVVVELRPHVQWRFVRKRIPLQQRRHRRFVFQDSLQELWKPAQSSWVVERSEPHLPVQARLVRDVPGRPALQVAWLVAEFVFTPLDAVGGTLKHDFVALRGHYREQTVTADDVQ